MTHQQMALDVALDDDLDFDHFVPGHNEELVNQLRRLAKGESSTPVLFVWGEPGSGKSHLLHACHRAAVDAGPGAHYLDLESAVEQQANESDLETIGDATVICVDGLDAVAGSAVWQERLFQLCNFARDQQRSVIISATRPPTSLGLTLRDLVTRLMVGLTYQVLPLNDNQKISALQERAMHRGFELNETAARYLLERYPRQTGYLFGVLDKLDRASLEQKRVVTIPFLRSLDLG
jgi:DnaA family protein